MSKRPKILLDPVYFDLLHLGALMFGGIGGGDMHDSKGVPLCKLGILEDLEPLSDAPVYNAGLDAVEQDEALASIGVLGDQRVSFERYVKLMNIDVKEVA